MAIASIHVDSRIYEEFGVGLWELPLDTPLEMRSLGKIVVLAGPNGGGKSRILRLVNQLMRKQLTNDQIDAVEHRIRLARSSLDLWLGALRRIEEEAPPQSLDEKRSAAESISSLQSQIAGGQPAATRSRCADALCQDLDTPCRPSLLLRHPRADINHRQEQR